MVDNLCFPVRNWNERQRNGDEEDLSLFKPLYLPIGNWKFSPAKICHRGAPPPSLQTVFALASRLSGDLNRPSVPASGLGGIKNGVRRGHQSVKIGLASDQTPPRWPAHLP